MTWRGLMIAGLLVLLSFSVSVAAHAQEKPFALWLEEFQAEAIAKGIPETVVRDALVDLAPNDTVVTLDRKQPEDKIRFTQYATNTLNQKRITKGQLLMAEHAALLKEISVHYKVQPQIIVALWGIETEFGANKGNFSLIQSLATLAYEGRRAEFFRTELLNALRIAADEKVMGSSLTGSWAGAMGHCQFMPSSYLKYAVDWDKDGHRDIWNSVPDALASIANYLHQIGWNEKLPWGYAVMLPQDFTQAEADLYRAETIAYWKKRGVTLPDGSPLPGNDHTNMYVMYPGLSDEGAWIVSENYHLLLKWNRSRYFAHAVGMLSDELAP